MDVAVVPVAPLAAGRDKCLSVRTVPVKAVAAVGELQVVDFGAADPRGVRIFRPVKDGEGAEHDALVGDGVDVVELRTESYLRIGPIEPIRPRPPDWLIGVPAGGLPEVGMLNV